MARIHIAYQEGFRNDEVVLRLDGKEVSRNSGVTTRLQIGLALAYELEVPDGPFELEVALPGRYSSRTFRFDPSGPKYVGISVASDGVLTHVVSPEPFGYL